jgi:tRNA(Ile)-lysidine synthetase-like protein
MMESGADAALTEFLARSARALDSLLPRPGWRVLAAISGGCDSVVLSWSLREAARSRRGSLVLGHVNHGLRAEADQDEAFVGALAAAWGLPLEVERVDVGRVIAARGWSREQAARVARFAALERLCRKAGCLVLALGHHMDDQAETLLMRILRGTGPQGLGGMRPAAKLPVRSPDAAAIRLIRPLLGFRRAEIRALAVRAGLEWREDRSNLDLSIVRNRVRRELLPLLERCYNPRIVESLAALARRQDLESEPIARVAAQVKRRVTLPPTRLMDEPPGAERCGDDEPLPEREGRPGAGLRGPGRDPVPGGRVALDGLALAQEPEAVISRVIWLTYQDLAGPEGVLGSRHMSELVELARSAPGGGAGELHLPGEIRARLRRGRLILEHHRARPDADGPQAAPGSRSPRAKNPLDEPDTAT